MSTDTSKKSYKDTLNLPQTAFPMEAKLVQNEPARLKRWQEAKLYDQLLAARADSPKGRWVLHDGPPFANGDIHIGHVINKTLKDVILRFRTMQGFQTPYVPGWDCHGLPIEHQIQEQVKKEGKNYRELGVVDVRQRCFAHATKFAKAQSEQFQRLGILGDWDRPYLTMAPGYEASTLEVFAKFVEAGLVYKQLKPVPWSVANQTALADAELEYEDVTDPSVYVEFPIVADGLSSVAERPESVHLRPEGVHRNAEGVHLSHEGEHPRPEGVQRKPEGVQRKPEGVHHEAEGVYAKAEGARADSEGVHESLKGAYLSAGPVPSALSPTHLLVWTTTPWTLPANLAVAVAPKGEYSFVRYERDGQTKVGVVATNLVDLVFKGRPDVTSYETVATKLGEELLDLEYRHPFVDRVGKVLPADYVTVGATEGEEPGTGLVHTAPGHGEDDYVTGVKFGLDVYSPVLANGRFDDTVPEFVRGKTTKEGNALITDELKRRGVLFAAVPITHRYPHDWRSKTPIIFRATEQWFVGMDREFSHDGDVPTTLRKRADRVVLRSAIGKYVEFVPEWGRHRLEGMLKSRPDWCVSRQRAWGLPIPVFYNEQGESLLTPESVRAVAKRFAEKGSDAWFTDSPAELLGDFDPGPAFPKDKLRKEADIFDVWFESGSSWHACLQARQDLCFPADLYLEGSDQHRGWFQLSLLPALGATGRPPFKQVLTHGFVVKPDGKKVSKSDKEYVKAVDEINRHGADLLRLWTSSVDYQNDIPTSPKVLQEFGDKYRKIRNTLRYLLSNLYDFNPAADAQEVPQNSLDGWALAELDALIEDVTAAYDAYQLHLVFKRLHEFCTVQISATYGNAMKDRLYCDAPASPLRRRCQTVMHKMAVALTKLLAPICVFTADEAWERITHKPAEDAGLASVHLALLPKPSGVAVSEDQQAEWKLLMDLRSDALGQLDKLTRQIGKYKALDAEVVYHVDDDATRRKLQAYGVDLADMVGCGYHSFAEKGPAGPAVVVEVLDRRERYQACARSWKRRPDVGSDAEYPDLTIRDAEALRARAS